MHDAASPARLRGVCAVLLAREMEELDLARISASCFNRGADLLELRLDCLSEQALSQLDLHRFRDLLASSHLPCIVTARLQSDGGRMRADKANRLDLLKLALEADADWIDLELEHAEALHTHFEHVDPARILISDHADSCMNAAALEEWLARFERYPAHPHKAVFPAQSVADALLVRDHLAKRAESDDVNGGALTLLASGGCGLLSRVAALRWGSALTYVVADDYAAQMPLMLCLSEYQRLYASTQGEHGLSGVAGSAVRASLSPWLHRAMLDAQSSAETYLPFECGALSDLTQHSHELNLRGLSVTIPHKQAASKLATHSDSLRAANTLAFSSEGSRAFNTDGIGFLRDLTELMSAALLARARVLVIGYGGSARAVASVLREHAGEVLVSGRNATRAKALAAELGVGFHPTPEQDDFGFDLIVNCTPCGMQGSSAEQDLPIDLSRLELNAGAAVYDLVYAPALTPLLTQAQSMGLRYRGGIGMLVHQAIEQQKVWHAQSDSLLSATLIKLMMHGASKMQGAERTWAPPLRIALIGYRASGKTSIAQASAHALGMPHCDLDMRITEREGSPVDVLLAQSEQAFREAELRALRKLCESRTPLILSTGGGTVEMPEARRLLRQHFTLVYLKHSEHQLIERIASQRSKQARLNPDLSLEAEVRERLARRVPHYDDLADIIIDCSDQDQASVKANVLTALLGNQSAPRDSGE